MSSRKAMIEKIKALLSKTEQAGCTEAEALAALSKASELMQAHNIAEADITFGGEGCEKGQTSKKACIVSKGLCVRVAGFTGCKVWREASTNRIVFFGLESDVAFATWLLETLTAYVNRATKAHLKGREFAYTAARTAARKGFEHGCMTRLNERLKELADAQRVDSPTVSDGHSLVVVKGALVDDAYAKLGLLLRSSRSRRFSYDGSSYEQGRAAGNGATIGRPVNGESRRFLA